MTSKNKNNDKVIAGNTSSSRLTETFLRMVPKLRHLAQRILLSKQETNDLLQEAFIRGIGVSENQNIQSLEDYFFIVTRNLAINERQKQKNNLADMLAKLDDQDVLYEQPTPEEKTYTLNRFNAFIRAANTLPEQCKRAFLLKHVHSYSQKDIAKVMGIAESTVEKHLAKGLQRCVIELEQLGYPITTKFRQSQSQR